MAVDRAEVVREVNVDTSGDHGDQGEEEGVCLTREKRGLVLMAAGRNLARGQRTEDEFFGWGEHVDGKGYLILVDL